jgi:TM2 domain-containing membrane protein YozV
MTGPGSGGNVIAALCSFIFPGLGQLLQGRLIAAAVHFLLALILWWVFMGWIMHLWSAYSAARYVPPLVY